jgi:hypothetical protein
MLYSGLPAFYIMFENSNPTAKHRLLPPLLGFFALAASTAYALFPQLCACRATSPAAFIADQPPLAPSQTWSSSLSVRRASAACWPSGVPDRACRRALGGRHGDGRRRHHPLYAPALPPGDAAVGAPARMVSALSLAPGPAAPPVFSSYRCHARACACAPCAGPPFSSTSRASLWCGAPPLLWGRMVVS